jgi:hypothetical protein
MDSKSETAAMQTTTMMTMTTMMMMRRKVRKTSQNRRRNLTITMTSDTIVTRSEAGWYGLRLRTVVCIEQNYFSRGARLDELIWSDCDFHQFVRYSRQFINPRRRPIGSHGIHIADTKHKTGISSNLHRVWFLYRHMLQKAQNEKPSSPLGLQRTCHITDHERRVSVTMTASNHKYTNRQSYSLRHKAQ